VNAVLNENGPCAAQWLRNLVAEGHLHGRVDDRSIVELGPEDCEAESHFFAGIGGWPLALRLAGWPADAPVWTGSCPCQPLSIAGRRKGADDERHLWPAWHALIAQCLPPVIFGEQVAGGDGRLWLDAVSADLEALGYAVGAADLCAAGTGAPHIRQRLYWVAYSADKRHDWGRAGQTSAWAEQPERLRNVGGVGNANHTGLQGRVERGNGANQRATRSASLDNWREVDWLPCSDDNTRPTEPGLSPLAHGISGRVGRIRAYGNAIVPQLAARFIRSVMGCL